MNLFTSMDLSRKEADSSSMFLPDSWKGREFFLVWDKSANREISTISCNDNLVEFQSFDNVELELYNLGELLCHQ